MSGVATDPIFGEDSDEDARDEQPPISTQPIELRPFQEEAVRRAVGRFVSTSEKKGTSQLIQGNVGSGKTAVAAKTILGASLEDHGDAPRYALVVTPSVGGNLPLQWRGELIRLGVPPEDVILFGRKDFLKVFNAREASIQLLPAEETRKRPLFVVTTFHSLHANVTGRCSCPFLLLKLHFDYMIVDEAQFYRNGSNKMDEADVDPEKKMFGSIMRIRAASDPRVLAVSATPFYNHRCDVYSLVVLMGLANGNKRAWQKDAEKSAWRAEKRRFADNHVVQIVVPAEVARADRTVHHAPAEALLGPKEIELMAESYAKMKPSVERVLRLMQEARGLRGAALASAMQELDVAMKVFLGHLVRCRRGAQHPAFFDEPVKVLNRNGKEVSEPVRLERYDAFAPEDCSKFNAVVKMLQQFSGRVLVTSQFSRPLDFLKVHLERHLPDWAVVVHHGGTDCIKALRQFESIGVTNDVAMLATMGSCGEGVNLSMTTNGGRDAVRVVCLDSPYSHSAQTQMEGRVKRPLAQPGVESWNVHRINSSALVPNGTSSQTKQETIDQALLRVLASKEHGADEVFMSEEELEHQAGETRASSYGKDAASKMSTLLFAVKDVCDQWERTESAERKKARLEERAKRSLGSAKNKEKADSSKRART